MEEPDKKHSGGETPVFGTNEKKVTKSLRHYQALARNQWALVLIALLGVGSMGVVYYTFAASAPDRSPYGVIESPASNAITSQTYTVKGWALDNQYFSETVISNVKIYIDGVFKGQAVLGDPRPDICAKFHPNRPGCPNVGWHYGLDTTSLTSAKHQLRAVITDSDRRVHTYTTPNVSFSVNNATGGGSPKYLFGVLGSGTTYNATTAQAGVKVVLLGLGWDQYETGDGVYNSSYVASMQSRIQSYKAAGFFVVLDFGIQYTPSWIFSYPNSRYVNQYGDNYAPGAGGKNIANLVFNATLRGKESAYMQRVLQDLGNGIDAVRTGGGWYGELNYPEATYNGHTNSYWGYDAIARGLNGSIASGVAVNPVPNWVPGTTSPGHTNANQFAQWYMNSLLNYQNWQISTVRDSYPGKIAVLYPSWGVRPGQLTAAISVDLNGTTSPEINGEVQRGFDFARMVAGISDANTVVYTTWLEVSTSGDHGTDQTQWSPVHYLASLALANPLHLAVWGENTGSNSAADMQVAASQMAKYGLFGMMWAFEDQLYSGSYATIANYQQIISQYNK